jgi:hypothetical protein
MPEADLLEQYQATGAEAVFAEIVRQHTGLVYSACYRAPGNAAAAAAGSAAFMASDVNGNRTLSMADVNLMVDRLLGRIAKFPVEL